MRRLIVWEKGDTSWAFDGQSQYDPAYAHPTPATVGNGGSLCKLSNATNDRSAGRYNALLSIATTFTTILETGSEQAE